MPIAPTFLHLNLSDQTFEVKSYDELIPKIGGLGWALSVYGKFIDEDPLVFAIGPLSGIFPGASKTIAVFKSPQTGGLATSLGGGHLARFLRFAGYQGMVVTGKAPHPLLVSVDEETITFGDATSLLALEVPKIFEQIFSSEGVPGRRSVLVTGPAAEAGFAYAPLYVDEFFSFPRLGLGRAFAQKNLKGLIVSGSKGELIEDKRLYREVFLSLLKSLKGYQELSKLGTLRNLAVEKKISGVPYQNLSEANFEGGEIFAEQFWPHSKRVSCGGCPVGCIHLYKEKEKERFTFYDYEGVAALGPLLGLSSLEEVGQLLARAWGLGLDPTSLGAVLAYLTEKEKLAFGSLETYLDLLVALTTAQEEWALKLRLGLPPEDRALTVGGIEFLPYFNGYTSLLSQALRLGATTEENRGFLLDLDLLQKEISPQEAVGRLVAAEERKTLAELLIGCGYLASVYEDPATAFAAFSALGYSISHEEILKTAREVFRQKLALEKRLGFDPLDVKIPEKFFRVPSPAGFLKEEKLREMIKIYAHDIFEQAN